MGSLYISKKNFIFIFKFFRVESSGAEFSKVESSEAEYSEAESSEAESLLPMPLNILSTKSLT